MSVSGVHSRDIRTLRVHSNIEHELLLGPPTAFTARRFYASLFRKTAPQPVDL